MLVDFDAAFRVRANDVLCVCGSTRRLARCQREFQTAAAPARRA